VLIEQIEKDCNGVGCITIWTNRYAFHEWQAENDNIYNCVMNSLPIPVFNETHVHTNIPFNSSSLPINANVDNGDFHAFAIDAYDGEMQPILYSCSQRDLGQRMLWNQGDLGVFGFLIHIPHQPPNGTTDISNGIKCRRSDTKQEKTKKTVPSHDI
jgi:hypothetical protein